MPYPLPTDPDYCAGSLTDIPTYTDHQDRIWHRCPVCLRPISAMPNGKFFAHVNNIKRARRRDAVQEGLIAHGLNQREAREPAVYGQAEEAR